MQLLNWLFSFCALIAYAHARVTKTKLWKDHKMKWMVELAELIWFLPMALALRSGANPLLKAVLPLFPILFWAWLNVKQNLFVIVKWMWKYLAL